MPRSGRPRGSTATRPLRAATARARPSCRVRSTGRDRRCAAARAGSGRRSRASRPRSRWRSRSAATASAGRRTRRETSPRRTIAARPRRGCRAAPSSRRARTRGDLRGVAKQQRRESIRQRRQRRRIFFEHVAHVVDRESDQHRLGRSATISIAGVAGRTTRMVTPSALLGPAPAPRRLRTMLAVGSMAGLARGHQRLAEGRRGWIGWPGLARSHQRRRRAARLDRMAGPRARPSAPPKGGAVGSMAGPRASRVATANEPLATTQTVSSV